MPRVTDIRKTRKISLPEYDGAVVTIYDGVLFRDAGTIAAMGGDAVVETTADGLSKLIKSWNLADENDAELPINAASLKLLTMSTITFISAECLKFAEEKKNS